VQGGEPQTKEEKKSTKKSIGDILEGKEKIAFVFLVALGKEKGAYA